jgi:hypothetical protein
MLSEKVFRDIEMGWVNHRIRIDVPTPETQPIDKLQREVESPLNENGTQ